MRTSGGLLRLLALASALLAGACADAAADGPRVQVLLYSNGQGEPARVAVDGVVLEVAPAFVEELGVVAIPQSGGSTLTTLRINVSDDVTDAGVWFREQAVTVGSDRTLRIGDQAYGPVARGDVVEIDGMHVRVRGEARGPLPPQLR